jgi:hypothetical protein
MPSTGCARFALVTIAVSALPLSGASCFGGGVLHTIERSKPQTVALTRKLPPVVDLAGARIRINVTKTSSVNEDPIDVMQTKLRAVLLKDRGRGISLDDPHPDTELRVKVTTFEITNGPQTKKNGNETDAYMVYVGNMEATVEVFDLKSGRALDSENLKDHYEKWFQTGAQQQPQQNGKAAKTASITGVFGHKPKTSNEDRQPTKSEQISDIVEGMANKVAQRLVPIDDRFDVELPSGFKELESYARAGNWGALKEKAESMTPLAKAEEDSCRLYLVGLSSEAIAYQEKDPKKAQDLLVGAADAYQKAKDENQSEEKFNVPINRAQQSLERYIALDKIVRAHQGTQARGVKVTEASTSAAPAAPSEPAGPAPVGAAAKMIYDNAYLIKLKSISKGPSNGLILEEIKDADPPQFDISPNGIAQLINAGFGEDVITAVKSKMRSAGAKKK